MEPIRCKVYVSELFEKRAKILIPDKVQCIFCKGLNYNEPTDKEIVNGIVKPIDRVEICLRCQSTKQMKIKKSREIDIPSLYPFILDNYLITLDAHAPYYIKDGKLHYHITLELSEIICGFRRKIEHPIHTNTMIVWPRGSIFHWTNKYFLPNYAPNDDALVLTFGIHFPDDIGYIPPKEPFSWRNVERFLGPVPFYPIVIQNIVLIDLMTLDYVPIDDHMILTSK